MGVSLRKNRMCRLHKGVIFTKLYYDSTGGGFGSESDGCSMGCGVVIVAEPAGWLQQGLVCVAEGETAAVIPSAQTLIQCGL